MSRVPGRPRVVFDCNICIQAIAFEEGAAAQSFRLMDAGRIDVYTSRTTIKELRRVLEYPEVLAISRHMTPTRIGAFLDRLRYRAIHLSRIPSTFELQRDPDDVPYLNLAHAAKADFLVSRDNDLLWLMHAHTTFGKTFRQKTHPLQILVPGAFLKALEMIEAS